MQKRDAFEGCHPVINFLYFVFVIVVTIFFLHPVLLGISFVSAFAYSVYLGGKKAVKFNLLFMLPLMLVAAIFNPMFNHAGVTILVYVNDNPITLEAIIYGVAAAMMMGAVVLWFSCYNRIMTSDKFLYLFGKVVPALSLIISMALRFIPHFKAQIKRITNAQRGIGKDVSSGSLIARAKSGLAILSVMITWALENSIETADSMNSRGYGLQGRTAYSNYRFDSRDGTLLVALLALIAIVLVAIVSGAFSVLYFPAFALNAQTGAACALYACYLIACLLPMLMDIKEDITWRYLRSKI